MKDTTKYFLDETRIPHYWYNIVADLPSPPPPVLHPGTMKPVGPDDLEPLFPMSLIAQEVTTEREVEIPEPVRAIYRQWRPTALHRARRLEKALQTPARIYYKYEGVSPAGSHKPNTAVAQAFYNTEAGIRRITTETGAGQWGSALAFAGALFGIEVQVFMVRVSYDQKPYRRALMETYGARCVPSPSQETRSGRAILAKDAKHPGSLGIAIGPRRKPTGHTDEQTFQHKHRQQIDQVNHKYMQAAHEVIAELAAPFRQWARITPRDVLRDLDQVTKHREVEDRHQQYQAADQNLTNPALVFEYIAEGFTNVHTPFLSVDTRLQ